MEKQTKSLIGVGLIGLAAYWAYNQLQGEEATTIGGSGSFTGLGGSESGAEGIGDLTGTSDSGINYNINLPTVDTSPIEALISSPTVSSNGAIATTAETPVLTKKESVSTPSDSAKSGGTGILNSLSTSLSQVFGTESQKTNERGDYYTTAAGGGAGAIKGQSLGEMAINLLSGKTASGQTVKSEPLPTGASTASNPKYDLSGLTKSDLQSIVQADKTKKEQQAAAIAQTKIAAPSNVDPLQALKDSGIVKSTYNPSSSSSSASSTTTKKEATTSTAKKVVSLKEASSGYAVKSSSSPSTRKVIKVKK